MSPQDKLVVPSMIHYALILTFFKLHGVCLSFLISYKMGSVKKVFPIIYFKFSFCICYFCQKLRWFFLVLI